MAAQGRAGEPAKGAADAKAHETPPKPAKRGRPPKAAAKAGEPAAAAEGKPPSTSQWEKKLGVQGAADAKEHETPPKPASKRGRPPKSAAEAGAPAAAAEAGDDAAEVMPRKRQRGESAPKAAPKATPKAAPKHDRNAPLQRSPTPRELVQPEGSRLLKLLSVNVAGLRAVLGGEKAQTLKALVERERPDVLCLNEHKLKESDVEDAEAKLKALLPEEYQTMHWAVSTAKKGYSGVAMVLRHGGDGEAAPIAAPGDAVVERGLGKARDGDPIIAGEGRVLTLRLPEFSLVATYVPNSGQDLQRLDYRVDREAEHCWDRALGEHVRELEQASSKPVVVLGDLNCGHRVQDIWNMYERPDFPDGLAAKPVGEQYTGLSALKKFAGLTARERESFSRLLQDAGLVDTFRALHPDASGVFSYFSQKIAQNRPLNRGLRLDYVLASSSMCAHLAPREAASGAGAAAEGAAAEGAAAAGAPAEGARESAAFPRIHDSFILDEGDLVADHAAVGCTIVLPPGA